MCLDPTRLEYDLLFYLHTLYVYQLNKLVLKSVLEDKLLSKGQPAMGVLIGQESAVYSTGIMAVLQ